MTRARAADPVRSLTLIPSQADRAIFDSMTAAAPARPVPCAAPDAPPESAAGALAPERVGWGTRSGHPTPGGRTAAGFPDSGPCRGRRGRGSVKGPEAQSDREGEHGNGHGERSQSPAAMSREREARQVWRRSHGIPSDGSPARGR